MIIRLFLEDLRVLVSKKKKTKERKRSLRNSYEVFFKKIKI